MKIIFRTKLKRCPECNKTLKAHLTETIHIIFIDNDLFTATHQCAVSLVNARNEKFFKIFESEIANGKKKTQAYVVVSRLLSCHVNSILTNKKPYRKENPNYERRREESVSIES